MGLDKTIREVDENFAVEKISVNGKWFWPFVKVFFFDAQFVQGGTQTSFSFKEKVKFMFSSLYGWRNWFGKTDYLVFSNSDQRKLVGGKFIDKSADYLNVSLSNTLHIELPVFTHFPLKRLGYSRVVSQLPLRFAEALHSILSGASNVNGIDVMRQLNAEKGTDIDLDSLGKRFESQYWVMKKLLAIKKPKGIFMAVPYMKMGYVLAAKDYGIPVIEMQHGTINKSHFGYANYKVENNKVFPDYLLGYGSGTKETFTEGNLTFDPNKVFSIGHYYLDLIQKEDLSNNESAKEIKEFKVSIAVSLQDDAVGSQIVPFLIEVAKALPDWLIVFVPRKTAQTEYEKLGLPSNVRFYQDLNVYQVMLSCKIHSTVFSTCALEAPSLGRPNVLVNIENKSKEYFGHILRDSSVTKIVDTTDQYIKEIEGSSFPDSQIIKKSNETLIAPNFSENLKLALSKILDN